MRVGDLEVQPVHDGWARMPAGDLLRFTGGRDDPWLPHEEFINADRSIQLSLGGFLVRTGDRVVLIDAGAGRISNDVYHGGQLLDSLAALGLGPGDVTDVVFTHLHFDHVGWATQKGNVVFPRATFRCHHADWEHFVVGPNPEAGSVRKLSPLADRLEPFSGDTAVAPGVSVRHAPGHTPGSAVIVVADGTERAILLGDVVHCPVELMENDWEAVVDVDPRSPAAPGRPWPKSWRAATCRWRRPTSPACASVASWPAPAGATGPSTSSQPRSPGRAPGTLRP